jgi:hypothetical protein
MVHDERQRSLRAGKDPDHWNIKMTERYAKLARKHIGRTSNTAREMWKLIERATPKVKVKQTDVRVLFAREILTRFFAVGKLLKLLVARDGIEPPTPAFSGPPIESLKWFEINGCY